MIEMRMNKSGVKMVSMELLLNTYEQEAKNMTTRLYVSPNQATVVTHLQKTYGCGLISGSIVKVTLCKVETNFYKLFLFILPSKITCPAIETVIVASI
jgi:hypothetical protein